MFGSIVFRVLVVTCLLLYAQALPLRATRNTVSDDKLRDLKKGLGVSKFMLKINLYQSLSSEHRPLLYKAVSEISQLMYIQKQVQKEVISQGDSVNQQLLATSVVLNATLKKACHWVSSVISAESFTCTEEKLNQIKLITTAQVVVDKLNKALRQYKLSSKVDQCQWMECNILSDLTIPIDTRRYILDNGPGICRFVDMTDFTTFTYYPNHC